MTESLSSDRTVRKEASNAIDLTPADLAVALWRERQPLSRPSPAEFDLDACMQRLRRLFSHRGNSHGLYDWTPAPLPPSLSRQEAHFWLLAICEGDARSRSGLVTRLRQERGASTGEISVGEACRLLVRNPYQQPTVMRPLFALFSPTELVDLILHGELQAVGHQGALSSLLDGLCQGFAQEVRPYLDRQTLTQMAEHAATRCDPSIWSQQLPPTPTQMPAYRLAPLIGMHRQLLSLVTSWPDDLYANARNFEDYRRRPREMIFGLGDPWQVEHHMRRLNLLLLHTRDARSWLAHTGTMALDHLVASIRAAAPAAVPQLTAVLCLVRSPEAARPLLELRMEGLASPAVRSWFEREVNNAVAGLVPVAAGRGKLADAARAYLTDVKRRGQSEVVRQQIATLPESAAEKLQAAILDVVEPTYPPMTTLPTDLRVLFVDSSRTRLPEWTQLSDLPPLVVEGKQLLTQHVGALLGMAQGARWPESPPGVVKVLKARVAEPLREAFVARMLDQWLSEGAPVRDGWVIHLAGRLGGDETITKLNGLMRDWVGTSGRQRSILALHAIREIGTPLALQTLATQARQARSRPLRDLARQMVESAARAKGLSRQDFEERTVPTLGFDNGKGATFNFGPRQFQAVLVSGGRVAVRMPDGSVRADLPNPLVKDDADLARAAIAEWRTLKKQVTALTREQGQRLERCMVSGRRWTQAGFENQMLRHPLLSQLARLLLWGGYDDHARLAHPFRINDDGKFVGADESPVQLVDVNSVRLVHPIEMTAEQRTCWQTVWHDHELVQPFAQLGRHLWLLNEQERKAKEVTAFSGRLIPALTITSEARAMDWQPILMGDDRNGAGHAKVFANGRFLAVIFHPYNGSSRYMGPAAVQEIKSAFFLPGGIERQEFLAHEAMPLGEVPQLQRSEVYELLAMLYAKGKG